MEHESHTVRSDGPGTEDLESRGRSCIDLFFTVAGESLSIVPVRDSKMRLGVRCVAQSPQWVSRVIPVFRYPKGIEDSAYLQYLPVVGE